MKKLVISPKRIYHILILSLIALTPIFNLGEILALLSNSLKLSDVSLTSVYIKLIKDAGFIAIICVGILNYFTNKKIFLNKSYVFFMICALFSVVISVIAGTSISYILYGARWLLPFLVLFVIYKYVNDGFQKRLCGLMLFLFVIGFVLQVWELFHLKNWFGSGFMGLSLRNPGFFISPTLMALFALMTMYYSYHFCKNRLIKNTVVYLLGPASVILAASGTGLISLSLFYSVNLYCFTKQKILIVLFSILTLVAGVAMLPSLTSRGDIYTSFYARVEIMVKNIGVENMVLSQKFGMASNTASTAKRISAEEDGHFVADSTITSIAYNTGLFSLVLFFSFALGLFLKRKICFHLWAIYLPFMMTNILFESFPANLLFVVNISYFYYLKYLRELNEKSLTV